ncbi:calcium-binding protein [Shimia ponticola]|uniref:calcium-binding protein n=1 Tax=Shimia ponticola TaxID=2582893 RepID=UPI00164B08C3|nr:calcium-binding protein [Shimia ponticola]
MAIAAQRHASSYTAHRAVDAVQAMLMLASLLGVMMLGAAFVGPMGEDEFSDEDSDSETYDGHDTPDVAPSAILPHEADGDIYDDDVPIIGEAETTVTDISTPDGTATRIVGTEEGDAFSGTDGHDEIWGDRGDDIIDAQDGDDAVFGGEGDDALQGGTGSDALHGEDGDDQADGGDGDDMAFGYMGADTLMGGSGDDWLAGGDGNDTLNGQSGDDRLEGGFGGDTITGGQGMDMIFGGDGDDTLIGTELDGGTDTDTRDFINGGAGDDTIIAGTDDYVTGGDGADTIMIGGWSAQGAAYLDDFNASEDQLVVVFDDTASAEPVIDLQSADDDSSGPTLLLDGVPVLTLHLGADVSLGDISLIGHSTIQAL